MILPTVIVSLVCLVIRKRSVPDRICLLRSNYRIIEALSTIESLARRL